MSLFLLLVCLCLRPCQYPTVAILPYLFLILSSSEEIMLLCNLNFIKNDTFLENKFEAKYSLGYYYFLRKGWCRFLSHCVSMVTSLMLNLSWREWCLDQLCYFKIKRQIRFSAVNSEFTVKIFHGKVFNFVTFTKCNNMSIRWVNFILIHHKKRLFCFHLTSIFPFLNLN